MSRTDEERIAIREKLLERLWEDASFGDGKVLTFDHERYGNVFVQLDDDVPESMPLFCFAELLMDNDDLREQYIEISDQYRSNLD